MYNLLKIALFVSVVCFFSGAANGQQQLISCANATNMNVTASGMEGLWFEVARNPDANVSCVQINMNMVNNTTMNVWTSYSNSKTSNYMNQNQNFNVTLVNATYGYNISYSVAGAQPRMTTLKILSSDYNNFALGCGYTNASDASTAFGFILSRQQIVNNSAIASYQSNGTAFAIFNGTMSIVPQSDQCYASSSTINLPAITTLLMTLAAILKYFN